jgi:uncharacterized protein (DUF1810 family)
MVAVVDDPFDLERFVSAQNPVYNRVRAELLKGRKSSHWMWFIFPQFRGLGSSAMAKKFGIGSHAEAQAYLDHPVLGPRLRECTTLVNQIEGRPVEQIFGYPDDLKFRSSMTLFASVAPGDQVFKGALERYFAGDCDARTVELLR